MSDPDIVLCSKWENSLTWKYVYDICDNNQKEYRSHINNDWGRCQVIYDTSSYNIMSGYFIIRFGHLYFLTFLHKMNNDFDPFFPPPTLGDKKQFRIYKSSYGNLNRHKHTISVRVQSIEKNLTQQIES